MHHRNMEVDDVIGHCHNSSGTTQTFSHSPANFLHVMSTAINGWDGFLYSHNTIAALTVIK